MVSYIKGSRMVVLVVLSKTDAWMDTYTVIDIGRELNNVPCTEHVMGIRRQQGGFNVFAFPDRTRRHIRYWVKKGMVEEKKEGRYIYFRATDKGRREAVIWSLHFK
jgi:hypothetical protein